MSRKLKELAGDRNETHLAQTIKDSAHQIWLAGLGAFSKAQEEGTKVFEALVKEGEAIQKRTREVAEEKVSDARKAATGTWDKLESVFEERVARALHSLNVPTKKDIEQLSQRVAELTAATKKLGGKAAGETGETATAAKAAGRRAAGKVKEAVAAVADEAEAVGRKAAASAKAVKDEAAKLIS